MPSRGGLPPEASEHAGEGQYPPPVGGRIDWMGRAWWNVPPGRNGASTQLHAIAVAHRHSFT